MRSMASMFSKVVFATILVLGFVRIPSTQAQVTSFIGEIRWVAFNFAPSGWALCNGQLLSIQQNPVLFDLLGTTYGGDGVHTFALPNLQGRVAIHAGQGTGLSARALGETGGAEQQTLTVEELPAHSHTFKVPATTLSATTTNPAGGVPAVAPKKNDLEYAPADAQNTFMATSQTSPTGGGNPVATMPPFTTLNCIIALQGVFPSQ